MGLDNFWSKSLALSAGFLLGLASHYLMPRSKKARHEVLFFPHDSGSSDGDSKIRSAKLYKSILYGEALQEEAPLARLLWHLRSAKTSIDLCLFVINSHQLAEAVLAHVADHRKPFRVRLIVDESSYASSGSAVPKFLSKGVKVRFKKMAYLMHHKFAVIDDALVITGSFNWTMQAIMGNKENVIVTSDPGIVQPFSTEFERLWREFDNTAGDH